MIFGSLFLVIGNLLLTSLSICQEFVSILSHKLRGQEGFCETFVLSILLYESNWRPWKKKKAFLETSRSVDMEKNKIKKFDGLNVQVLKKVKEKMNSYTILKMKEEKTKSRLKGRLKEIHSGIIF